MNDNMRTMFCTKIKLLTQKKCTQSFIVSNFSSFCLYLLDTHNLKNICELHGSNHLYGVKKSLCHMPFFLFSKIKVLLRHQYQVIHSYENLRCCT